ncbi:hypothetical protein H311_04291, partial [Anncaliia algerae PRA109]
ILVFFDLFYILMTLVVVNIPYTIYIRKMDQQKKRRCKITFYIYFMGVIAASYYNYTLNILSKKAYLLIDSK